MGERPISLTTRAKWKAFEAAYRRGLTRIAVVATHPGVGLPPAWSIEDGLDLGTGAPMVVYALSPYFPDAAVEYGPDGIVASLSFDGSRHRVEAPWEAISIIQPHDGPPKAWPYTGPASTMKH